jgi:hypothetical protein
LDGFLTVTPEVAFPGEKIFKAFEIYIVKVSSQGWDLKWFRSGHT